jgi:hypothetical protein
MEITLKAPRINGIMTEGKYQNGRYGCDIYDLNQGLKGNDNDMQVTFNMCECASH